MYKLTTTALLLALVIGMVAADAPTPIAQSETGKKALAKIRQSGGLALELAQNDQHLEVSYLQTDGKFGDEQLAVLKDLKGLVRLNLRGQPVTDAQLVYLKPLTDLTELHLEKTKITDKGLLNLKGLVNLEYLNLYGTGVSDAGLVNLEGMKKLKRLYVWETKVTEAGAAKLKKVIPSVDVNLGAKEEPEPKKEVKKPEPKKEEKKKPEAKKEEKKDKKPEPSKDAKTVDEMIALHKARVALAQKGYEAAVPLLTQTKRLGNVLVPVGKPENVYSWSVRWLQAQRDLSLKHEDQVAALEAHLTRMTELQKQVKNLKLLMSRIQEDEAEWYRLEAQLWLAKAKPAKTK